MRRPTSGRQATPGPGHLPTGWRVLRDCNLSPPRAAPVPVPLVLLHPEIGVALIEAGAGSGRDLAALLRARLDAAGFTAVFPGHLPILHLQVTAGGMPALEAEMARRFAEEPPIAVAGGRSWVNVVARALAPRETLTPDPEPTATPDAGPPVLPVPVPRQRQPWLWGAGGLALGLVLAGLGAVLLRGAGDGPSARREAGPVASPASSAPAAAQPGSPSRATPGQPASSGRVTPGQPAAPERSTPGEPGARERAAAAQATSAGMPRTDARGADAGAAPAEMTPDAQAAPLPPPPSPEPSVVVRSPANLRTAPTTASTVLRTAPRGERFRVLGRAPGGWVEVGGPQGPLGWIHDSLLEETGAP